MSKRRILAGGHNISGVFVFLLIAVFALASVTLVLTGVNVYSQVTKTASGNTDRQVALSYLLGKVHAYDHENGIYLEDRNGVQVLCLREAIEGEAYETLIYFYDGAICEQFSSSENEFVPDYGERLTAVQALQFTAETPELLKVSVTLADGSEHNMHMGLRSGQAR